MDLGPLLLSILVALPLAAPRAQGRDDLVAAAAAAGRPPECSPAPRRAVARGPSVWERARTPNLQRYCDLLARGQAQLGTSPGAARDAARLAEEALPGHAAPSVLLARASLALGELEDAARAFARARSLDPRSVEDPHTLHDLARTLARTGKRDEAMAIYRALVPRIDLLGTGDQRAYVLLEAAHLSMTAAGAAAAARGPAATTNTPAAAASTPAAAAADNVPAAGLPPDLDEAIAYLREARQRSQTQLTYDVLLSLALALDRAGDRAQADAALTDAVAVAPPAIALEAGRGRPAEPGSAATPAHTTEAGSAGAAMRADNVADADARLRAVDYVADAADRIALEALALERSAPAAAAQRWETYLAGEGGKGPWASAARQRLEALRAGSAGGGRRPAGATTRGRPPREQGAAAPSGPRGGAR